MQTSLPLDRENHEPERIRLLDAEILYYPQFLTNDLAMAYFQQLSRETHWRQDSLNFGGKTVQIPRLQAWYGEKRANYGYSGLALTPDPWTPLLNTIKQHVESVSGTSFNSVLLNYYRDGNDSVAWHSDDEQELGPDPVIASLSLGAARRFELKHRAQKIPKSTCELTNGSLIVMGNGVQVYWQHQIPKQPGIIDGRINLTFRKIFS